MKKRHYNLLAVPAAAVIVFSLFSGFSEKDPGHRAEALLITRTEIFQNIVQREISSEEAEEQLRAIEGEALLTDDIALVREGDLQKLRSAAGLEVRSIKEKKQFFEYNTYEGELLQTEQSSPSEDLYNIVVKEENETFKITVLEPAKV